MQQNVPKDFIGIPPGRFGEGIFIAFFVPHFTVNSLENAVAFDLEHREPIEDLTDYSYEALAEGYFGVRTDSSEIQMRLQRMEELIRSDRLSISDKSEFQKIPEAVAPAVKAKYYDLKREWQNKN